MSDGKEIVDEDVGLDDEVGESDEVELRSKEGKAYKIGKNAAKLSQLVRTTLGNDSSCTEIELIHIEGAILSKIVEYMKYHEAKKPVRIPKPLPTTNIADIVDPFDAKFCDVDQESMFKLLLAANYMDIKPLLLLMCAKVASMIQGKAPAEIRRTFNIRDDFTPEEEEEVRNEYKDLLQ